MCHMHVIALPTAFLLPFLVLGLRLAFEEVYRDYMNTLPHV